MFTVSVNLCLYFTVNQCMIGYEVVESGVLWVDVEEKWRENPHDDSERDTVEQLEVGVSLCLWANTIIRLTPKAD